jgi:hypothetical protein
MTRNEIITHYYQDENINTSLATLCPEHLRNDLKQHIFLILLEKPEGELIAMHFRGQIRFFIGRIIINSIRGNGRSSFNKLYNPSGEELTTEFIAEDECPVEKELSLTECVQAAENLYWYNRELLNQYLELGSYRKVAEKVGIPHMAVFDAVKKAKQEIKEKIK